jgi:hypothetical protein
MHLHMRSPEVGRPALDTVPAHRSTCADDRRPVGPASQDAKARGIRRCAGWQHNFLQSEVPTGAAAILNSQRFTARAGAPRHSNGRIRTHLQPSCLEHPPL